MSCRSPTESRPPRSPTGVSIPSGRLDSQGVKPSSSTDASASARVAPMRPKQMFSSIVVSKRKPSCGTIRIAARRDSGSTDRRSRPPTVTTPSTGSARRANKRAKVVFPLPVSPTMATFVSAGISTSTSYNTCSPVRYRNPAPATVIARGPLGSWAPASGSSTAIGTSSTRRIFHHPASAVWVWSSTSPNSAIGFKSRLTRNRNATSSPTPTSTTSEYQTPTPTTAASESEEKKSTTGRSPANQTTDRICDRYWLSMASSRRARTGSS